MELKKVLGLDIGTNSIGASLLELPKDFTDYSKVGKIIWCTSRIVPIEEDYLQKYESGEKAETKAAARRIKRASRRLKHRYKLRRTKLIQLFKILEWLPDDFPLDNPKRIKEIISMNGKFNFRISDYIDISDESYKEFYRQFGYDDNSIDEIIEEIKYRRNSGGKKKNEAIKLLPEDWVVYYLRKKALSEKLTYKELIRVLYLFNQRRGFESSRKDLKENNTQVVRYDEFRKMIDIQVTDDDVIFKVKEGINDSYETKFVSITKVKKIKEIIGDNNNEKKKFKIFLEDIRVKPYIEERKEKPDWEGKEFTLLVTQKINKGGFKQNTSQKLDKDDWQLSTVELDNKMADKYPGEYFFDELVKAYKSNKNFKIRQYAVYRSRYKEELKAIWKKQCELNNELRNINNDKELLKKLAEKFYPTQSKFNGPKLKEFLNNDLFHIIFNDIIYYQRDLKSQKSLIGECRYEKRKGKDGEIYGLKCIPISSPLFQEFRIWQYIHNIKLIRKEAEINGKKYLDIDETKLYINDSVKEKLLELFDNKADISEKEILQVINSQWDNSPIKISSRNEDNSHRINLFRNREKLEGNQTKYRYYKVFKEINFDGSYILENPELLFRLWHADYSHDSGNQEKTMKGILSALGWKSEKEKNVKTWNFFKLEFPTAKLIAEAISKLEPLNKKYGSFSALAIRKLLVFMRTGKFWKHPQDIIKEYEEKIKNGVTKKTKREIERIINSFQKAMDIAETTRIRLEEINYNQDKINEISDDEVPQQILKSFLNRKGQEEFIKGLNTYQAAYLLYGKHSEQEIEKASSPEEYQKIIQKLLKPGSLRNPVVESVVRETCLLVKDVWKEFGNIDEIHIELARELKHNAIERKKISDEQNDNFKEKQRIKKLLNELLNYDVFEQPIENIDSNNNKIITTINERFTIKPNPANQRDIERFRLWKNQVKYNKELYELEKEINKIIDKNTIPTEVQIKKYILWLTQNCRSPYTGKIIPLSRLFDGNEYEIDHIIPRSKLKNDSMNNLVVVERAVNKAKDNELAANFIQRSNGICEYEGKKIELFSYDEYKSFVDDVFRDNRAKRKNLLSMEVPDDFVERQINDTRYIGRKLNELLRPVLTNHNNIIFTIGSITNELKNNWCLNEVWKDILRPRFERLEKIINKKFIYQDKQEPNKYHFDLSINENLEKKGLKRLDYRHHALDAIIVAATTREHIRFFNTLSAADSDEDIRRYKLTLCKEKIRDFKLPWPSFVKEVKESILSCSISYKESKPVITKPFNKYKKWIIENNKIKKEYTKQEKNGNGRWLAVRRNLFKEPLGTIWLKEVKQVNIEQALKIQVKWNEVKNDKLSKKTTPYIYDDYARKYLESVVEQLGLTTDNFDSRKNEIRKWIKSISLKNNITGTDDNGNKKTSTVYLLDGITYKEIPVAVFTLYKTKRMSLENKEYTNGLNLQKMKEDFPYFVLEKDLISKYPEIENQLLEDGFELDNNKKNSPVNRILLEHILEYNNNPKEAFSAEGLNKLNEKAIEKIGKPIKSISRLDGEVKEENLFKGAFYETDKGANVYFIMYENLETKEREFLKPTPSISALKAIEKRNKIDEIAPNKEGYKRIVLSPGDLVYMPTADEIEAHKKKGIIFREILKNLSKEKLERIYQVKSFTGKSCYFLKYNIADVILPYKQENKIGEFESQNKSEYSIDDIEKKYPIKNYCVKIKINRLGFIEKVY